MSYLSYKILAFLTGPGSLLLSLLMLGILLLWTRRRSPWGRLLVTIAVLAWAVIAYTPLVPHLVANLEDRYPAEPPLPAHVDGIIVLGGAVEPVISQAHGQATVNRAGGRMIEAARLARLHPEASVLVSGGNADPFHPEIKEAATMAEILIELGVSPERIIQEDRSRNTRENAIYAQALVRPSAGQQWVLITSALHMPRSVALFQHIGWSVIAWPSGFRSGGATPWINADLPSARLESLADVAHERIGLLVYRLLGWIDR
jgi:uncharacterized SAM-binding protein YcdF (DUF218 family)